MSFLWDLMILSVLVDEDERLEKLERMVAIEVASGGHGRVQSYVCRVGDRSADERWRYDVSIDSRIR